MGTFVVEKAFSENFYKKYGKYQRKAVARGPVPHPNF